MLASKSTDVKEARGNIDNTLKVAPQVEPHRTATLIDNDTPLNTMINGIDGKRWQVDSYFNQITAEDDGPSPVDKNLPDAIRQYQCFKNLIIYMDDTITPGSRSEIAGSGRIIGITPQQGDVFVATVPGERRALLRIVTVKKVMYDLQDLYLVEFKYDIFLDRDTSTLADLITKTVRTYVFDSDASKFNNAPIMIEEQYNEIEKYRNGLKYMEDLFVNKIADKQSRLLILPNKTERTIDPYLEEFFFEIVNEDNLGFTTRVERSNIFEEREFNIFDALIDRNKNLYHALKGKTKVISTSGMPSDVLQRNPSAMGIKYIVVNDKSEIESSVYVTGTLANEDNGIFDYEKLYPYNSYPVRYFWRPIFGTRLGAPRDVGMLGQYDKKPTEEDLDKIIENATDEEENETTTATNLNENIDPALLPENNINHTTLRPILPVITDGYYLLSSDFLTGQNRHKLSAIEIVLEDYMENRALNREYIKTIVDDYNNWSKENIFYYLPLLMMILRYHIGSTRTDQHYTLSKGV